ncbi:MAG TPA: 5'-3' exonuclease H3TH domain-containing protein [Acidimicrobiales bacterium]|nr:5'-3' exonuclease H3TH domain-containing protein [Acidimicrobiales bacterium]
MMRVFLVDGTYELFRHFHGAPPHVNPAGLNVGAARTAAGSILSILEQGATHIGVATDHVIESWRNEAWPAYKSSAGVPKELLDQFGLFEDLLSALGIVVWPMIELEADDAMASAAAVLDADPAVTQVVICTPDKDLGQCVRGGRVVCLDRRKNLVVDEPVVRERFGVGPESVPDWLAVVGDSADGYPGIKGWGAKSASAVLHRYEHIEQVPLDHARWDVPLTPARTESLRSALAGAWEEALLFKRLATATIDPSLLGARPLDALQWTGPTPELDRLCAVVESPGLARRARELAQRASTS